MKTLMIAAMAAFTVGLSAAEANLALNKTVTSSSIQEKGMEAKNAVDGKKNTRWGSAFKDNQWIMVDLGSVQKVGKVVLTWEAHSPRSTRCRFPTMERTSPPSRPRRMEKAGSKRFPSRRKMRNLSGSSATNAGRSSETPSGNWKFTRSKKHGVLPTSACFHAEVFFFLKRWIWNAFFAEWGHS